MENNNNIIVGISIGDINGIGIEIILKTFEDKRMLELCTPVLFASKKIISKYKSILNLETQVQSIQDINSIIQGKLNLINVWNDEVEVSFGTSSKEGGKYALLSLEAAVQELNKGSIDVLVTAPINKNTIQSETFNFPGHTEYLQSKIGGQALMILMSDKLKVALMTGHIPIDEVSKSITPELIREKIEILNQTLLLDFSITKPKIAILSINPHAGDNGVIGNEDKDILIPTIEKIQKEGKLIYGPYAADSFFGSGNYQNFDAILATYHDQGLTPFKTLAFGNGVNYTAGLDKIRTSPDHGTAFDIAGKGIADFDSFKEAVYTAIDIFRNRTQNSDLIENALESKNQ
jgi:4-hydroxythreonine-4-phosphate dehydrogenase